MYNVLMYSYNRASFGGYRTVCNDLSYRFQGCSPLLIILYICSLSHHHYRRINMVARCLMSISFFSLNTFLSQHAQLITFFLQCGYNLRHFSLQVNLKDLQSTYSVPLQQKLIDSWQCCGSTGCKLLTSQLNLHKNINKKNTTREIPNVLYQNHKPIRNKCLFQL